MRRRWLIWTWMILCCLLGARALAEGETDLRRGARGAEVRALQTRLAELGFFADSIDGDFGRKTEEGVKSAQAYLYELARLESGGGEDNGPAATTLEKYLDPDEEKEAAALGDNPLTADEPLYEGNGVVDSALKALLMGEDFPVYLETIRLDTINVREIRRLQTRLSALHYLPGSPSGVYDEATKEAIFDFREAHGLRPGGEADEDMQTRLYSAAAKMNDMPRCRYKLLVSVAQQRVFAYAWSDGAYVRLVKTMVCSTGAPNTPTPKGSFKAVGPVAEWSYFPKYVCWAKYLTRIKGPYLFHSLPYEKKDEATMMPEALEAFGAPASHGCVRLMPEDAQWIYDNCPAGTTVEVY